MILTTSLAASFFCLANVSQAASSASSSYSMGLNRNTLSSARALAPRFINSSHAARACGALPAHSDICALRSSHSALCGSASSAASVISKAAFKSPAAAKVSQANCSCPASRVLASNLGSAVMAITLRRATPASRASPAPSANWARYHQALSPGGRGSDSFKAACQALRESPVANNAWTPFSSSCRRVSGAAVLRRAAKNKSLACGRCPALKASDAPRASSCAVAAGRLSSRASSASCMVWICRRIVGWLIPSMAASASAAAMDVKTCAAVLALSALRFKRASNSEAARRMSASLLPSMAWPSCVCHQATSHLFQSARPDLELRPSCRASSRI